MDDLLKPGRYFLAFAMTAFATQLFLYGTFLAGLPPVPPGPSGSPIWAYLAGALLVATAAAIAVNYRARWAAALLGAFFVLSFLFFHVPGLAMDPHNGSAWTGAFETLALGSASFVLGGVLRADGSSSLGWNGTLEKASRAGRIFFAVSLLVFGTQHFLYARFIATLVPSWIPGHLFWAYFVGAAFVASGLAILTRRAARLGAMLLAVMFFLWVLLLHGPRVAAALHDRAEWTSAFVALAMSGGALTLASNEREERIGSPPG